MAKEFSPPEVQAAQKIAAALTQQQVEQGIAQLRTLKDDLYAAIPANKRQSQGITWVLQRISALLVAQCQPPEQARPVALTLYQSLPPNDRLLGVPIFLMAAYGQTHLEEVLGFFAETSASSDWVVREFAAAGLHLVIPANREAILPWLQQTALSTDPCLRRLVSEALRPVTLNRWLQQQPDYSLSVLRLLFRERDPYPRTSVGNNLSDLSGHNAERIFAIVQDLVASGDPNSYWIAYRACRNLVKKDPSRVMKLLNVSEYHYKDRHFVQDLA